MIEGGRYTLMLEGLKTTLIMTAGGVVIGLVIGMIIAIVKYLSEDSTALKPFAKLCDIYVTVIRGVPIVVLLLIFFFSFFYFSAYY